MLGGVKSAIGLIFKMLSFDAGILKIGIHENWLFIRLFCQIAKIQKLTPLVLLGLKCNRVNFQNDTLQEISSVLKLDP